MGIINTDRRRALWNFLFGTGNPGVCYWCEKKLTFRESTFDHVPPRSKSSNVKCGVISCHKCNHSKVGENIKSIPDYLGEMRTEYTDQDQNKGIELAYAKQLGLIK